MTSRAPSRPPSPAPCSDRLHHHPTGNDTASPGQHPSSGHPSTPPTSATPAPPRR
jgi:hypothetical protein